MDEIPLVSDDEAIRNFIEEYGRIPECFARGHPYQERIVGNYQPGRPVFVQCTNCNGFYHRLPTGEEIQDYTDMLNLEVKVQTA